MITKIYDEIVKQGHLVAVDATYQSEGGGKFEIRYDWAPKATRITKGESTLPSGQKMPEELRDAIAADAVFAKKCHTAKEFWIHCARSASSKGECDLCRQRIAKENAEAAKSASAAAEKAAKHKQIVVFMCARVCGHKCPRR